MIGKLTAIFVASAIATPVYTVTKAIVGGDSGCEHISPCAEFSALQGQKLGAEEAANMYPLARQCKAATRLSCVPEGQVTALYQPGDYCAENNRVGISLGPLSGWIVDPEIIIAGGDDSCDAYTLQSYMEPAKDVSCYYSTTTGFKYAVTKLNGFTFKVASPDSGILTSNHLVLFSEDGCRLSSHTGATNIVNFIMRE